MGYEVRPLHREKGPGWKGPLTEKDFDKDIRPRKRVDEGNWRHDADLPDRNERFLLLSLLGISHRSQVLSAMRKQVPMPSLPSFDPSSILNSFTNPKDLCRGENYDTASTPKPLFDSRRKGEVPANEMQSTIGHRDEEKDDRIGAGTNYREAIIRESRNRTLRRSEAKGEIWLHLRKPGRRKIIHEVHWCLLVRALGLFTCIAKDLCHRRLHVEDR